MKNSLQQLLLLTGLVFFLVEASAEDNIHLLGFVDGLCVEKSLCFEFRAESVYSGDAGEYVRVYYDENTQIFDPENYEVTLVQSNIVVGSHLRILMEPVLDGYFAGFIWVGD